MASGAIGKSWAALPLWQRRAIKAIAGIGVLIVLFTAGYHALMIHVEGRSQTLAHSFQVVVETHTGTGYGSASPWETTIGNLYVSAMDLSTFLILFIAIPYVLQPVLQAALSPRLPTKTDASDHVIICGWPDPNDPLVRELTAREIDYVVLTPDADNAHALLDAEVPLVHGDPTSTEGLDRVGVERARAVVVLTADEHSASVVLAIRERAPDVRTVVVVNQLEHERPLRHAGADAVLRPRELLGRRLAERAIRELSAEHSDMIGLGDGIGMLEITHLADETLLGGTIAAFETATDRAVRIIGAWDDGTFIGDPPQDTPITEDTSLLVLGPTDALTELEAELCPERPARTRAVIAGYGMVGSTVADEFESAGISSTVIDLEDRPHVTVVGDATDAETLRKADIATATMYVVALPSDHDATLSILLADELAPELNILVRANESDQTSQLRRAGAEYVLALPEVSGRMLAEEVLHEEVLAHTRQVKIVRHDATAFAGRTLGDTPVAGSNCAVPAVRRDGELLIDISANFQIEAGDELILVGTDADIDALRG